MTSRNGSFLEKTAFAHGVVACFAGISAAHATPFNLAVSVLGLIVAFYPNTPPSLTLRFLILVAIAFLVDIVWLGLWTSDIEDIPTYNGSSKDSKHTGQFAVGMTIICLLLKPVMAFFGYRVYSESGGSNQDYVDMGPEGEQPGAQGATPYVGVSEY